MAFAGGGGIRYQRLLQRCSDARAHSRIAAAAPRETQRTAPSPPSTSGGLVERPRSEAGPTGLTLFFRTRAHPFFDGKAATSIVLGDFLLQTHSIQSTAASLLVSFWEC
eukprot:1517927-Pleurochrysis_carterae.AAC.1